MAGIEPASEGFDHQTSTSIVNLLDLIARMPVDRRLYRPAARARKPCLVVIRGALTLHLDLPVAHIAPAEARAKWTGPFKGTELSFSGLGR